MYEIKRTNSTGDEIQPSHLTAHADVGDSYYNNYESSSDGDQLSSTEDSSHRFGLVASGNESEGEYSASRLNSRRDMSTMSKAPPVIRRGADADQDAPPQSSGTSYGSGLHVYPSDTRRSASTSGRNAAAPTSQSSGSRKKSARDLMLAQAGKARGGAGGSFDAGSSAYTTSGSGNRSVGVPSRTEMEKLKFRINTRRNVSAHVGEEYSQGNSVLHAATEGPSSGRATPTKKDQDDFDDIAAVTPSPPMRRVRSNPHEKYADPDVAPLSSPESSTQSSPRGLRGSKSVDYESGNDDGGGRSIQSQKRSANRKDGGKSPHMHRPAASNDSAPAMTADPVTPPRRARIERQLRKQMELGQVGQGNRQGHRQQPQSQQRSVHFGEDQARSGGKARGSRGVASSQPQQQSRSQPSHSASRAIGGSRSFESLQSPPASPTSPTGSDASSPSRRDFTMLATSSPATALNVGRDGPHATIVKLRRQLDETLAQNERSKTALARSDAVILELRRDLRETSSKLSKSDGERELIDRRATELERDLSRVKRELHEARTTASARSSELAMITDEVSRANQRDAVLGELQLKLDRTEAQILTADMRNQQLEEDYHRDKEEWEMGLARKEDELDKLRAELGAEVSSRKDAEQFWKQSANTREEKMRELEAEIARLMSNLRDSNDRVEAVRAEREMDREALDEVDELRADLDEAAKVLDDTRNALNEALDELAKVRKEKDRAECDRDIIREEMDVLATKLEQETGEKHQLAKERNALRQENSNLKSNSKAAAILAEREAKISELSMQLSAAKDEARQLRMRIDAPEGESRAINKSSLVRSQMEKADLGKAKRELEAKNARIECKFVRLETERDELKRCLDDAMNELEIADAESKEAAEYKQRNIEMESKVNDLDNLISQRDGEISELRLEIAALEGEIQGGASRGLPDPSAGQSSSRARIENKRRASESKLRALMGQVAHSIDKRKDPDGFGTSRAIAVDSDEDASSADEHVSLINHSHVQEVKLKLQATEEALENTQRELDELRRESGSSTAVGSDIFRSKSADSAMPGGEENLSSALKEERARAQSLEAQLASANEAVRSRDKSSAELRGSLKEAVSLLKPLKEHVAQAEKQKEELRNELAKSQERISALERQLLVSADGSSTDEPSTIVKLHRKEQEVDRLKKEVKDMEETLFEAHAELSDAQERLSLIPITASSRGISDESSTSSTRPVQASNQSTNEESDTRLRVELQRTQEDLNTRRKTEKQLKQMLERTQQQLQSLSLEHEEMTREKAELERGRSGDASVTTRQISTSGSAEDNLEVLRLRQAAKDNTTKLREKDNDILKLREQLRQTQVCLDDLTGVDAPAEEVDRLTDEEAKKRLKVTHVRISQLEEELSAAKAEVRSKERIEDKLEESLEIEASLEAELSTAIGDLKAKEEAEKTLNKSLKEAVEILKPLQGHVETVEKEKLALINKLTAAENRIKDLEASSSSRALSPSKQQDNGSERTIKLLAHEKALLEQRVEELQRESMDAEQRTVGSDMTKDVHRLQERLAEMERRYNTTKNMLDQSAKTNASLLQDLKEMEEEDEEAQEQIALLTESLEEKGKELTAAKYIATTAIAKVDSMSVTSGDAASRVSDFSGSNRFLPRITEDEDAQKQIAKLQEELRRAKQKNDRLVSSIRKRDQQIMGSVSSNGSTGGSGRNSRPPSEANTEATLYHQYDIVQQLGGQESGAARR